MASFDITDPLSFLKEQMMETLRLVIDPELHINIIDLGLVYGIEIEAPKKQVKVEMTLSSSYCPMGESIVSAVKNCIEGHYEGYEAAVDLVWEPVWSYDSITDEGKRLLGL
ncbi:metal-sulfur cluster assembly factor [Mucilaginibacter sp.]|uniref:metal-sulfur cluster assembly factor n=1 Tax=Mucilaginibacter sp. TaxID=1882438 RepID=UPI0025EEE891|nr:metal-sulfur cluster assembly factor [Mucilaginibacter sp.]